MGPSRQVATNLGLLRDRVAYSSLSPTKSNETVMEHLCSMDTGGVPCARGSNSVAKSSRLPLTQRHPSPVNLRVENRL